MPKLYTFYERILAVNMEKMRLDRYLSEVLGVSRAQIAHLIDKKMVLVNGVVAKKSEIVGKGDDIKIAESSLDSAPSTTNAESANKAQQTIEGIAVEVVGFLGDFGCETGLKSAKHSKSPKSPQDAPKSKLPQEEFAIQIQRIYEDDDILVLNKPPFLATHGAPSLKEPSLVEWLKAHKIQRSTISGELREGIVHRLDKQTSGALVVAKNNDAHNALSAQLADKTMGRLYLAIIDLPLKEDIEIECYLARNPKNRLKISKVDVRKYKKFAESSLDSTQNLPKFARYSKSKFYKLLPSKDGKKELILAKLFTGRTHQIRAHLESINRHIVGDELYGYKRGKGEGERVMLHAYLLELTHPKGVNFAESRVGNSPLGLHSADFANLGRFADSSPVSHPKFAKNHESQTENPSVVDSARGAESSEKIKSKKPFKSFCYFWLSPKVESSLPLNPNLPNNADSTKSQNLGENQAKNAESNKNSPSLAEGVRGWVNFTQVAESTLDSATLSPLSLDSFRKRAAPPTPLPLRAKSCRFSLLGGEPRLSASSKKSAGGTSAPFDSDFLHHEAGEFSGASHEFNVDLSAQACEEIDSANPKLRFIAPLFDDMKDYLAKNFDMEKVYEILHALPARAF